MGGIDRKIIIEDSEPKAVKALIEFAYTGDVDLNAEILAPLLCLADCYEFDDLTMLCAQQFTAHTTVDTVVHFAKALRHVREKDKMRDVWNEFLDTIKSDATLHEQV